MTGQPRTLPPRPELRLHGYCSVALEELARGHAERGSRALEGHEGAYVVTVESADETLIVSSPFGIVNYFYAQGEDGFHHGPTLLDVLERARLPWAWNHPAVGDLLLVGHCLGSDTLHPAVSRMPPGSVVRYRAGELHVERYHRWEDDQRGAPRDPAAALAALNDSVARWCPDSPVLSLSGGFDSRVLLGSLLAQGRRPRILTMGEEDSTDMSIVSAMTRRLDLPLIPVRIRTDDYFEFAEHIASITNGTKLAMDWHTFIYPRRAELAEDEGLLVGTCGELARTTFLDRGIAARAADWVSPLSKRPQWQAKLSKWLRQKYAPEDVGALAPGLRRELVEGAQARVDRCTAATPGRLLAGLDTFYLEQKVPHFYGNGFRLYSECVATRLPYLSREWLAIVRNLPRTWKMGSNFHRYAIARNQPALMDFPIESEVGRGYTGVHPRARAGYWLPRARAGYVHYTDYDRLLQGERAYDYVLDASGLLEGIASRAGLEQILDRQRAGGGGSYLGSFLLAMAAWMRCVEQRLSASPPLRASDEPA